jgi:hypothetical protein
LTKPGIVQHHFVGQPCKQAACVAGAGAALPVKQEKQRVAFWRGKVFINMPEGGMHMQALAEVSGRLRLTRH